MRKPTEIHQSTDMPSFLGYVLAFVHVFFCFIEEMIFHKVRVSLPRILLFFLAHGFTNLPDDVTYKDVCKNVVSQAQPIAAESQEMWIRNLYFKKLSQDAKHTEN